MGGNPSSSPILMNSHVEPQIVASVNQARTGSVTARNLTVWTPSHQGLRIVIRFVSLRGRIAAPRDGALARSVAEYFELIWTKRDGHYAVDCEAYQDDWWIKRVVYRLYLLTVPQGDGRRAPARPSDTRSKP